MFTFVSGGLRSGKSGYALRRASELGPPPWLYIAPDAEGDEEFKARLARHRRDQDAIWRVRDAPARLEEAFAADVLVGAGAMVVDRFDVWLGRRLVTTRGADEHQLIEEVESLSELLYHSAVPAVLVTTEIGLGPVPASAAERRLIDLVGLANQVLAERAQSVVFMVSGIPQRLR